MNVKRLLGCAAILALTVNPVLAGQVGVTAAVLPQATGTPPDGDMRVLQIGIDMFADERVVTGDGGRAQLLFLDGTALSVGPNSDLKLDEFVYDPKAKTGKLAMSATKGVFRLVGGRISKNTPIILKTPTATIGVRGGIALINITSGRVQASFLFGHELTVTTPDGASRQVDRPGTAVSVEAGKPATVAPAASAQIGETLTKLEGTSGAQPPEAPAVQDSDIAGSQIASLASARAPQDKPAVAPKGGGPVDGDGEDGEGDRPGAAAGGAPGEDGALLAPPSNPLLGGQLQLGLPGQLLAQTAAVEAFVAGALPLFGGLLIAGDPVIGELTPMDPSGLRDPKRYLLLKDARLDGAVFTASAGGAPIRLPILDGEFDFDTKAAGGTLSPFGPLAGIGHAVPDRSFIYYTAYAPDTKQAVSLFAGVPSTGQGAPLQAFNLYAGFPEGNTIPFLLKGFGGDLPDNKLRPMYWIFNPGEDAFTGQSTRSGWGAVVIDGNGPGQRSAMVGAVATSFVDPAIGKPVFAGVAEGFARDDAFGSIAYSRSGNSVVPDGTGNWSFGKNGIGTEYFVIDSDLYTGSQGVPVRQPSQVTANLFDQPASARGYQQQVGEARPVPASVGKSRSTLSLRGYAGGLAMTRDPFNMQAPVATAPIGNVGAAPGDVRLNTYAEGNTAFMRFDLLVGNDRLELFLGAPQGSPERDRAAFIDDQVIALLGAVGGEQVPGGGSVPGDGARLLGSVPARADAVALTNYWWGDRSAVPGNVSICGCSFMTWGFWGADVEPLNPPGKAVRTALAGFVVGDLPSIGAIPPTGTATFNGHAMANVKESNGAQYTAFGRFQQQWDFSSRSGTVTITNLAGRDYTGSASSANGRELNGSLAGANGAATGHNGSYDASFFRDGGDAAAGIGGNIKITGPGGFQAGGVVVGRR